MNVMWRYLDKRTATINAIKDYESMQFIIASTDEEIKQAYDKMSSVGGAKWDDMPKVHHNPQGFDEKVLNAIEEIDILKERYQQAVEYMNWFQPAWKQMTDEERYVLENFYGKKSYGVNAVYYIAEYLKIEVPTVYKRKNRALDRLTILLFGKS